MALFGLISKLLLSLLMWPLAICLAWALLLRGQSLPFKDGRMLSFLGGMGAYGLIQAVFWRPLFVYVMGHELTHALAAVLHGGRADDLHVSSKGGRVKVDVSNFLVNLAPYFFPIYTFALLLVFWISDPRFQIYLVFLLGFSLAFHWALTVFSLKQHQSDIAEVGWLFALPFIFCLNLIILAFVLSQALPGHWSMKAYLAASLDALLRLGRWCGSIF